MINQGFLIEPGAIHSQAKMSWQQINLRNETVNAFHNWQALNAMHEAGRVHCLSTFKPKPSPAMVIGSGATLDDFIDELAEWPYPIFCSTSQASTIIKYGRKPEYLCILDPTVAQIGKEWAVPPGSWSDTTLLAHPSVPNDYLMHWFNDSPMPAYLFRILEPTYDWYTHHLYWGYPWIRSSVLPFIDSAASMITLATKLGYNPLYLAGIDYGGPRFDNWSYIDGEWVKEATSKAKPWENIVGEDQKIDPEWMHKLSPQPGPGGLETTEIMKYCMRGTMITSFLSMVDRVKKVKMYLLSDKGNLTPFLPVLPWKELKAAEFKDTVKWTQKFRTAWLDAIETYLSHMDTFLVPLESGFPSLDYRVYMMNKHNALNALTELNKEIMVNKSNFERLESEFNISVGEMIAKGMLSLEKGELLIHEPTELAEWKWQGMKQLDVEAMMRRIDWLTSQPLPGVSTEPEK